MADISLIICSRDRAEVLRQGLQALEPEALARFDVEVLLVDSASSDATAEVMRAYAAKAPHPVTCLRAEQPGVARAQNLALRQARGELMVFTDDDCRLAPDFFDALAAGFDRSRFDFGGGRIVHGEADADPGMAATSWLAEDEVMVIPPRRMMYTGTIQGANMFAKRQVFQRIGGFSELLGPGSVVGSGADTEFSMRACMTGFRGVMLGRVVVSHHHGKSEGSAEAQQVMARYARGRGGYYASLITLGAQEGFGYWRRWMGEGRGRPNPQDVERLVGEFRAAADYMEALLQCPPPARPGWRGDYPDVIPQARAVQPAPAAGSERVS